MLHQILTHIYDEYRYSNLYENRNQKMTQELSEHTRTKRRK